MWFIVWFLILVLMFLIVVHTLIELIEEFILAESEKNLRKHK